MTCAIAIAPAAGADEGNGRACFGETHNPAAPDATLKLGIAFLFHQLRGVSVVLRLAPSFQSPLMDCPLATVRICMPSKSFGPWPRPASIMNSKRAAPW
jgi:hypothetical protein